MPRLLAVFVLVLHFCAGAVTVSASSHLSSDPRVKSARALVKGGQFHQALTILRPLAPDHPDQTDVRFLIGLAAIGASRQPGIEEAEKIALLDEAIAALHSILVHRPGLVRVRLELALAFFLKEEDGLARQHFERVLAGRPTRAVAANVNRFLRVIRDRRRWSGYFGFSIAPDSNVNSASDAKYIYIYGLPFRRNEASRATSGTGVVAWGGGEYRYPLAGPLRLRSAADFAHREYSGKDFDQTFVAGRAGPHWTMSRNTELSLLASADQRWLAGARSSHDFGVLVEAKHRAAVEGQWTSVLAPALPSCQQAPRWAAHGVLPGRNLHLPADRTAQDAGRLLAAEDEVASLAPAMISAFLWRPNTGSCRG